MLRPSGDPDDPGGQGRPPTSGTGSGRVPRTNPPKRSGTTPRSEPGDKIPSSSTYGGPDPWLSKDMSTTNTRPGWQLGDDPAEYDWWRRNYLDPRWATAYGSEYIAFEWYAWKTDMGATTQGKDDYTDTLLAKGWTGAEIPGWDGGGGGGGGRGGGGGGGGASTEQQIAGAAAAIKNQARTIGLDLDDDAINSLASVVVTQNWSADQLNDYLAGGVSTNAAGAKAGSFTAAVDFVRKAAAAQLMPISDDSAREWAGRMVSGEMDDAGVRSMFQSMAKMKYAWAQPSIDAGLTMRDFLTPSRDRVAQELERNAEDIDLMDPEWQNLMTVADEAGNPVRVATDLELIQRARGRAEFKETRKAPSMLAEFAATARDYFGA